MENNNSGWDTIATLLAIGAVLLLISNTWASADQIEGLEQRIDEQIAEIDRLEEQIEAYQQGVRDGQIR